MRIIGYLMTRGDRVYYKNRYQYDKCIKKKLLAIFIDFP